MQVNTQNGASRSARRPHRKVKTGCKTCRIRRVKCDEERPSCLKCKSTGRSCDGYTAQQKDFVSLAVEYAHAKSSWFSKTLATIPDFGDDMRYLEFYYYYVGPKLAGKFDAEFWSCTILQMAHVEAGVRAALIALGHLNQRQSGTLLHARQSAATLNDPERKPFWINYNKAIRHLLDHMAKPTFSAEVGLVICLLFACIEFLQADANVAFNHIRSGLNLVHELRQGSTIDVKLDSTAIRHGHSIGRSASSMIERILVPILTQALASALPYGVSLANDFVFLESCPRYFTGTTFISLVDARASFLDLRNAAILLARDMAVKLYGSVPLTSLDLLRQADLLRHHSVWLQALNSLENSQKWSNDDMYALSALKVGYYSSHTACSCIMDKTQMAFDAHLEAFESLVAHAICLINYRKVNDCRTTALSSNVAANFTFDTSLIPALFFTAIRCRCPTTRRKAVNLLALDLPREGLWDPEQHMKVAERVIEIEEMNVDRRGWPNEISRLCRSSVETEVEDDNGFQAHFLYTRDLALASERCWTEKLYLGERQTKSLSPLSHQHSVSGAQNP